MAWFSKKTDRKPGDEPTAPPPPGGANAGEFESALDTLASVLRAFARYPIEIPESGDEPAATLFEKWAQHILIRTESPSRRGGSVPPGGSRDFRGLVHFVQDHRRTEHEYQQRAQGDMRQAVWAFIGSLNQALASQGEDDVLLEARLEHLRRIAQTGSPEELRRESLHVTNQVAELLESRRRKKEQEMLELGTQLAELTRRFDDMRRESELDGLTKLHNRAAFDRFAAETVSLSRLTGKEASLLLIDVDHFKQINDRHGHLTGDEVLRALAHRMARVFLRRDDRLTRYGGEEFAVILPETTESEAEVLAARLLDRVRATPFDAGDRSLPITVSIGLAQHRKDETVAQWIERTDQALYASKREGRDRLTIAT